MKKLTFGEKVLLFLVKRLGTFTYRLVCSTYIMKVEGLWKIRKYLRPGVPRIGACWHQRSLCVPLFTLRLPKFAYIVSQSKDGQMIAYVLEGMGYPLIRGSSSKRGLEAMSECRSLLMGGTGLGITPDGPRGPGRKVQPGTAWLSMETGAAVLPMAISAKRAWWARGWDRFMFPKPFTEILVVVGDAILPPKRPATDEAVEDFALEIAKALDQVTAEADRRYCWRERRPRACLGLPERALRPGE